MLTPIRSEVTVVPNLAIGYHKDYELASQSQPIAWASIQAIYTNTSPAAAVMASASKVTAATQATVDVTVLDYTNLAGAIITINGVDFVEGVDWTAAASNGATATSIAAIIPAGITGAALGDVATFTNTAYGTIGDANTISTDAAITDLTVGSWANGVDAFFSKAAHGLSLGAVGLMTTSVALPTGLVGATPYYVIVLSSSAFALASSLVDAQAGVRIQWTDTGTGNQTFTPSALGGVVVKLQMSNDGINFTDITGKTVTIAAGGSILWDLLQVTYRHLRVLETPSAGAINLTLNFNGLNWI